MCWLSLPILICYLLLFLKNVKITVFFIQSPCIIHFQLTGNKIYKFEINLNWIIIRSGNKKNGLKARELFRNKNEM